MQIVRLPAIWQHANFRRLWYAQTISLLGSQVTLLALPLTAIVTLHASAWQLGLLRAVATLPALLFGLVVGVLVDRRQRKPLLMAADVGRAVLLTSIPLAAAGNWLHLWQLFLVAFGVGCLSLLFEVADAALLPVLVQRDQVTVGNSQLELSRAGSLLFGPVVGGLLVQVITAPFAMGVDALSFLASALCLRRIHSEESAPVSPIRRSLVSEIRDGWHTVWQQPVLRALATSLLLYVFFMTMLNTLYVLYLTTNLQLAPALVGMIFAVGSLGFPLGAAWAGPIARRWGMGPTIVWGAGISDAAFLLIPLAQGPGVLKIGLLLLAQGVATLAGPVTAITQVSLRQISTPDHLLGRATGTMRFLAAGMAPLGALCAGILGEYLGIRLTLLIATVGIQLGFVRLLCSPLRHIRQGASPAMEKKTDATPVRS